MSNDPGIEVDGRQNPDTVGKEVAYHPAPEWDPASAPGKEAYNDSGLYHDAANETKPVGSVKAGDQTHRIFGLRRRTFFIVCVLSLLLVIIGVVVGGVVGSRSHGGSDSTSSSQSTVSSTSSASSSASTSISASPSTTSATASLTSVSLSPTAKTGTAANECPAANGSIYNPGLGYSFQKLCGVDWPTGENSASGDDVVDDIVVQIAYSIDSCIDACYQYSLNNNQSGCAGVTYNANLTSSVAGEKGNCFLKSAVGGNVKGGDLVESAARVKS